MSSILSPLNAAPQFVLYGSTHLLTMAVIALTSVVLPLLVRRWDTAVREVARVIAVILITQEILGMWVRVALYDLPLVSQLPFDLCGAAVFLSAFMLWQRSYGIYEIIYFWGLAGTLQAILTPDLEQGFPHIGFLIFFLAHGLIIVSVLYATLAFGFRPTPTSIGRAIVVTLVFAALVAPLNYLFDTNFLYLRHKPVQPTLMDYMGPWPWYILALVGAGVVSFLLCYSPFFLLDRWRRRDSRRRPLTRERP